MKLTLEKNNGEKITVEFNKNAIIDLESDLDPNMGLEPLWEALKTKVRDAHNG